VYAAIGLAAALLLVVFNVVTQAIDKKKGLIPVK